MVLADSFYYQLVQIDTINTRVNADLFAKEGDANGRGMVVQITENGIIKDTTGITLRLQWSHLSVVASGFKEFEVVDATKGLYKVQYPTSMLHRGRVEAFIRIADNDILSGTRNLLITVERMVGSDETIEAADDFSALQSALTKLSIWESTISGKADKTEVEVERRRIDNLIALPEGATTNDARLEDIKIGADGTIYDSPGNAVRKIGADLNQNIIPLQNEFENGNFKNTGGWSGKVASVSVSENVLKVVPNGTYARILTHTINNLIVGDTYYISLDFKTLKETDAVNFPNFSPVLYFPDNVGMGEFTTISGISKATSSEFRFNMYTPPDATDFSTYEMYVKNAIAINLSKTFSDSNRPTKELLDALVLGSPTIWWGERNAFSQKQLFDLNNLKIDAISNNKLKVMSFNCGTWYDGVTRVPDIEVEEITFYTRKLFGEFDCDFVLGQEFSEYFDVSNTILAIPHVMDFKYEYNTEGSYEHVSSSLRCPVISKFPISGTSLTGFSSGVTKRHYVKTYSQINGKNVCFISTLLDKNDTYRLSQMQQLITVMNQEEYVVLGGDFNIKDKVEYAIFTNAGYALANGGVLGWFDTLASYTDEVVRPIDNIIVSPNIRIENVFVDEKRADDHRAIIAELSF